MTPRDSIQLRRQFEIVRRNRVEALRIERSVVHAVLTPGSPQERVHVTRPTTSPRVQTLSLVPGPLLFRAEPGACQKTRRQQHVHVRVFAILIVVRSVGHHPATCEVLSYEAAHQTSTLLDAELPRQRQLDLTADLGVFPAFGILCAIPELCTTLAPARRPPWGRDLAVIDAGAPAIVVHQPSCIPSFCKHQITPKTSRYTRCSMSMLPNVSINGRIRSSGQLGRWWYSISPCRNNECVRRFTVFAFNQRS